MHVKLAFAMLLLSAAPAHLMAARKSADDQDDVTFLDLEEDEEALTETAEQGTEVFTVGADTGLVQRENEENPDAEITNLVELRTQLKFVGNNVELRNPDMVPQVASDIADQQAKFEESKFLLCLHVGTTAGEIIKEKRPGFMEGRVKTLHEALEAQADALGVGDFTVLSEDTFEHFESTRFAGLVMKVYKGDAAPQCKKEDLVPPPA